MNKLFGLLFGICLVCAVYWAYPKCDERIPEENNAAQKPVSLESASEENVPIPMEFVAGPEPEKISGESWDPAAVVEKESEIPVMAEKPDVKNWQVIWTPFRTKGSAMGFASRVSQLTGLEMDVRNMETGKFLVAFAYGSEEERQEKIKLIEDQVSLSLMKGDRI